MTGPKIEPPGFSALSRREREILAWVLMGLSTKQIARELGISKKTVETHRTHCLSKLGLQNTGSQAALFITAVAEGWLKRGDKGGVVLGFEYERRSQGLTYETVSPPQ